MNTTQTAAVEKYLGQCETYCSSRIGADMFPSASMQTNALRGEPMRDESPRCGRKPPEHWAQGAKDAGWGRWVLSGGSPAVFGHCTMQDCPMMRFFATTAPTKALRSALADRA